jgi:hypothetical protein
MATTTASSSTAVVAERDTLEKTVAFLQKREGIDKVCVCPTRQHNADAAPRRAAPPRRR